jgi:hypothetical protein
VISKLILLTLCTSLAQTVYAQPGPIVWVVKSIERVERFGQPGTGMVANLRAARGESESFQIAVQGPPSGLTNVSVSVSDLTGEGGTTISSNNFTLYREAYVYISTSSPNWYGTNRPLGPGWYADGLIPFTDPVSGAPLRGAALQAVPFQLPAGENQPIWVDLSIPRNSAPGKYDGTFLVTSDQGTVTGRISLKVWNFTLPLKPSLSSSFLVWIPGNTAAAQELLRNKLSPLSVDPANQPGLIQDYGLKTVGIPFWSGADIRACKMSAAPTAAQFQAAAVAQHPSLQLYDYSADEIGKCSNLYPILRQWGSNMHQAGINHLVTMAPVPDLLDDGSGTGRSAVDIWVMLPLTYDHSQPIVLEALAKGDSAWSYNGLVQDSYSPKWEIDFAPINFRIQPGFISQSLSLSGLLYWRVDNWSSDPWNQVNNAGVFSSNNYPGEGMLVYPGKQVGITGVAPSMRLKWLRDGVEDYEYVELMKKQGLGPQAMDLVRSVAPDWANWTRNTDLLAAVRDTLGQRLDELNTDPKIPAVNQTPPPIENTLMNSSLFLELLHERR